MTWIVAADFYPSGLKIGVVGGWGWNSVKGVGTVKEKTHNMLETEYRVLTPLLPSTLHVQFNPLLSKSSYNICFWSSPQLREKQQDLSAASLSVDHNYVAGLETQLETLEPGGPGGADDEKESFIL